MHFPILLGLWLTSVEPGAALNAGRDCIQRADYSCAERHFRSALAALPPSDPRTAIAWANLGATLYLAGRLAESEAATLRALEAFGPGMANEMASALSNLATLYRRSGRFQDAEAFYHRAQRTVDSVHGVHSGPAGVLRHHFAELYRAWGRTDEAERHARAAVALLENAGEATRLAYINSLLTLGIILESKGELPEAEALITRSLALREAAFPPNDPRIAPAVLALASLRLDSSRVPEAEQLLRRALSISQASLGPNHPYCATALNNLAQTAKLGGRFAEAEDSYRRALAIWEKTVGQRSIDYALTLSNFADLYRAQGKLMGAERMYRRSIATLSEVLGPDHAAVQSRRQSLQELTAALERHTNHRVSLQSLRKR